MNLSDLHKQNIERKLVPGLLLVAEPFLADPNFSRAVIFLCEHSAEGSVGFILNKPTEYKLGDLLSESGNSDIKVRIGGPVEQETLHMLHRLPVELNGKEVLPGIYWGGVFDALGDASNNNKSIQQDLKLFIGYSGWSPLQLEHELKEGSWLIADATEKILFDTTDDMIWKAAILSLGGEFTQLINMPVNPQLN